MTQQQKVSFIQRLALELSKEYKKEGYYLSPAAYYEMAEEVFESNENDFSF